MTNGEKYKTAEERTSAFRDYCEGQVTDCKGCPLSGKKKVYCQFVWLELEAEVKEEKPMNCPFCGNKCVVTQNLIRCLYKHCAYTSGDYDHTASKNVAVHNHVCKAVAAYKEGR